MGERGIKLRLAGGRQSEDIKPGVQRITGRGHIVQQRGNKRQLILIFRTDSGAEIRHWFDITSETISPLSAYARAVEVLLGRTLEADDDLNPEQFVGVSFEAECGFRFDGDLSSTQKKKDAKDFLRARKLLRRVDNGEDLVSQAKDIFGGRVVNIVK